MKTIVCINCKEERTLTHSTTTKSPNKYCDQVCQAEYQLSNNLLPRFIRGEISNRRTLKRIIAHLYGNICTECGNAGIHNGKELKLQLDHKDGNAANDFPDNVRLLCPNCHSQTPTFTAKNKGSGRGSRKISR